MHWLLKTEPTAFSFADLQKAKETRWDGITNATALKHLRTVKAGDELVIYHTGDEKAAVGTARVTRAAYADPKEKNEKLVVIDITAGVPLARPVTLAQLKASKAFEGSELVRISRLSVVPLNGEQWAAIHSLAKTSAK